MQALLAIERFLNFDLAIGLLAGRLVHGPFGDMPLVVLSHDPQGNDFGGFFSPADLVKAERSWMEMQEELRGLIKKSKDCCKRKRALGANPSP